MKSADQWAKEFFDHYDPDEDRSLPRLIDAIRDEMKDELTQYCIDKGLYATLHDIEDAIRAIGKPRFVEGQLIRTMGTAPSVRRWYHGYGIDEWLPVLLNGKPIIITDDGTARLGE